MKRKVITVNEEKCTGCGNCIPGCPEGALQIIDGKARLVSDLFCDGLGACIGECPTGAMSVEEREAEPYNEYKVMANIVKGGENTIKAHLKHLDEHNEKELLHQAIAYLKDNTIPVPEYKDKLPCGCPGNMTKTIERNAGSEASETTPVKIQSKLANWPVQLQLLNPNAPYLKNCDLVIAADCVPFAFANFYEKFLKNKVLTVFCPKLDKTTDQYIEKLAEIFLTQDIKSVTIVHMEVPCCSGVNKIVEDALLKANKFIITREYTISINGEMI